MLILILTESERGLFFLSLCSNIAVTSLHLGNRENEKICDLGCLINHQSYFGILDPKHKQVFLST